MQYFSPKQPPTPSSIRGLNLLPINSDRNANHWWCLIAYRKTTDLDCTWTIDGKFNIIQSSYETYHHMSLLCPQDRYRCVYRNELHMTEKYRILKEFISVDCKIWERNCWSSGILTLWKKIAGAPFGKCNISTITSPAVQLNRCWCIQAMDAYIPPFKSDIINWVNISVNELCNHCSR